MLQSLCIPLHNPTMFDWTVGIIMLMLGHHVGDEHEKRNMTETTCIIMYAIHYLLLNEYLTMAHNKSMSISVTATWPLLNQKRRDQRCMIRMASRVG